MAWQVSSVLQNWVQELPWKQQSILLSGLRGPDQDLLPSIKHVSKWIRFVSQNNADPSKAYMNDIVLPEPSMLEKELEHSPCHFVHHFADALAVVAYGHPSNQVSARAFEYHAYIAEEIFHFITEHPEIFKWRHRDKPNGLDANPIRPFEDRKWMNRLLPEGYIHR